MADVIHQLDRAFTVFGWNNLVYVSVKCIILFVICNMLKCDPIQITRENLCRYVAFLGRSYTFCTVQQYLNIVRLDLIHLELGLKNPLKENWFVSSVLSGIQRGKGASQYYELSVDISMLRQFHQKLNHIDVEDSRFWSSILWCYFGLGFLFVLCIIFVLCILYIVVFIDVFIHIWINHVPCLFSFNVKKHNCCGGNFSWKIAAS